MLEDMMAHPHREKALPYLNLSAHVWALDRGDGVSNIGPKRYLCMADAEQKQNLYMDGRSQVRAMTTWMKIVSSFVLIRIMNMAVIIPNEMRNHITFENDSGWETSSAGKLKLIRYPIASEERNRSAIRCVVRI
jgi:hypothetical protein